MYEHESPLGAELLGVPLCLRIPIAGQHDFRTEGLDRFDLDLRRRPRHDDDRAEAQTSGGERDALSVIAGARRDDSARALRGL